MKLFVKFIEHYYTISNILICVFISLQGGGYLKRANTSNLQDIFNKYASVEKNGEKYMTSEDFIRKFLGLFDSQNYNKESVHLLASILDNDKDGYISYPEFQAFEGLLCFPDALYKMAFRLFDVNGNGVVSFRKCYFQIHS